MDETSVKGQSHQGCTSNCKAFANSCSCVPCCVETISNDSDFRTHIGHLGDSSCVVADGPIAVYGKTERQVRQHTQGGQRDSVVP